MKYQQSYGVSLIPEQGCEHTKGVIQQQPCDTHRIPQDPLAGQKRSSSVFLRAAAEDTFTAVWRQAGELSERPQPSHVTLTTLLAITALAGTRSPNQVPPDAQQRPAPTPLPAAPRSQNGPARGQGALHPSERRQLLTFPDSSSASEAPRLSVGSPSSVSLSSASRPL